MLIFGSGTRQAH